MSGFSVSVPSPEPVTTGLLNTFDFSYLGGSPICLSKAFLTQRFKE